MRIFLELKKLCFYSPFNQSINQIHLLDSLFLFSLFFQKYSYTVNLSNQSIYRKFRQLTQSKPFIYKLLILVIISIILVKFYDIREASKKISFSGSSLVPTFFFYFFRSSNVHPRRSNIKKNTMQLLTTLFSTIRGQKKSLENN